MKKSAKALVVSLAVAASVTGAAAAAPAATAAPTQAAALSGFHLYQNTNYGGGERTFTKSLREFSGQKWTTNGQSMQNSASSMQNFTGSYVILYNIGTSCSGSAYSAKPNSQDASFDNNNFDNNASCLTFI